MPDESLAQSERDWEGSQRLNVFAYLQGQGFARGEIGNDPAWSLQPYVSVWAVESLVSPGRVGWWAVSGDLPTDYCSADDARDPRSAVKKIAKRWEALLAKPPESIEHYLTNFSAELEPFLASRAALLLAWTEDEAIWPEP